MVQHISRTAVVLGLLALSVTNAPGQTNVPAGLIDTDTVWSASGSPYSLGGNVLVAPGVTLTIDPGVELHFHNTSLVVSGRLFAEGSESHRILFLNDGRTRGEVRFSSAAPSESSISYCSLSFVDLVAEGSFPQVAFSSFGEDAGIFALGIVRSTMVTITDCQIHYPTNLEIDNVDTVIFARNISNRRLTLRNVSEVRVHNNTISSPRPLEIEGLAGSIAGIISGNELVGNDRVVIAGFVGQVVENVFTVDRVNVDGSGGIWLRNDFTLGYQVGPGLSITSLAGPIVLNDNNFSPYPLPQGHFIMYTGVGFGSVIDAKNNWWGTTDPQAIESAVHHFVDSGGLPFVDFVPFRAAPIEFCTSDVDCVGDGLFCTGPELCVSGICESTGDPCLPDGSCEESADTCGECVTDTDCDDTLFCNGQEKCTSGLCRPGRRPDLDDGVDCTVDECNEGTDSVDHLPDDGFCDSGLFCDGVEICRLTTGCASDDPPDCDDGVNCTEDSCNEVLDACDSIPVDSLCDDGLFCNGDESCDSVTGCQAGVGPCTGDLRCDEDTNLCVECLEDPDRDTVCDDDDNCPFTPNVKQTDSDRDGYGNACDNCPATENPGQADRDRDSIGDLCDNCPGDPNFFQEDDDRDESGDPCDLCPGFDDRLDDDRDGVPNGCDQCPAGDDAIDTDRDGVADACDPCPADNPDDSDQDTICDSDDVCPGHDDTVDYDGDWVPDACDNCRTRENRDQADFDLDGMGDECDEDIDSDGFLNNVDVCDFTPLGSQVQPDGGLLSDLDGDCDVDLDDHRIMQAEFTGSGR